MQSVKSAILSVFAVLLWSASVWAGSGALEEGLAGLGSSDSSRVERAIESLASSGDARALAVLQALQDGELYVDSAGKVYIHSSSAYRDPLTHRAVTPSGKLDNPQIDNRLRRSLGPAIASLSLFSPDEGVRSASAEELSKRSNEELAPTLRKALASEKVAKIRDFLSIALAQIDLSSTDVERRLSALAAIKKSGNVSFKSQIEPLVAKNSDGSYAERDERVRAAAAAALSAIETKMFVIGIVGHLFYGLSLGSVLLLAALGLAITFGLMRVINMAHGEMLMIGAYTTFSVQNFFLKHFAAHSDWYLLAAVPAAFVVCFAIGVVLERTVIRFLYGRPLETLLSTWGISLLLIQTVRLVYGAQNVTVANPKWLSGGFELLPNVVITYSRLVVIGFSVLVVTFVWLLMQKTSLGLQVRAVTQNRAMAAAVGVATRRVDMMTFGFGSGIAGLGGVALSQLGNVGPELGQSYIVDSFMVVVLGGVGKIAGAIAGALGLGIANKLLEPAAGAVLGKIIILGFIILFIQKRPQGIFALKGRAAEPT